ncbi:MAG: hypothetical protein P1U67_06470 [Alcanivoracaceae bacterium]|nr:hypothetical protein [Alcanivoracaceae bacterium]
MLIKESMSGWLRLSGEGSARDFSFSIRAFTSEISRFSAPRAFRGIALINDQEMPCHGVLTLHLDGPSYWLELEHSELGALRIAGKKAYGKNGFLRSLVTCAMTVTRDDQVIGMAEVAYLDSIVAFPFKCIRFVDEHNAYTMQELHQ